MNTIRKGESDKLLASFLVSSFVVLQVAKVRGLFTLSEASGPTRKRT